MIKLLRSISCCFFLTSSHLIFPCLSILSTLFSESLEVKNKAQFVSSVNILVLEVRKELLESIVDKRSNGFRKKIESSYKKIFYELNLLFDLYLPGLHSEKKFNYILYSWIDILSTCSLCCDDITYDESDRSLLDKLCCDLSIPDCEKKIAILIQKGLLILPDIGGLYFLDGLEYRYKKIYDLMIAMIPLSNKWTHIFESMFANINLEYVFPNKLMQANYIKYSKKYLEKNYYRLFQALIKKGDEKSIKRLLKVMRQFDLPLLFKEQGDHMPVVFEVPLLSVVLRQMKHHRISMNRYFYSIEKSQLIIDNPMNDFIEYYFYEEPFNNNSFIKMRTILNRNRFSRKNKESLYSYIKTGQIRNTILEEIGKRHVTPWIERRRNIYLVKELIRNLNSSMDSFSELSVYNGFDALFLAKYSNENLLYKSLLIKDILCIEWIFFAINHHDALFENNNNILHAAMLFAEEDDDYYPDVDRLCCKVLSIFLCSKKLSKKVITKLLTARNNVGLTPLDIAAQKGYESCYKTLKFYQLVENI